MQNKANYQKSRMSVSSVITMNYEQRTMNYEVKNKANSKPIQSQFKANTNPKQTQYKAKQTQFHIILACFSSRAKNAALQLFAVELVRIIMLFKNVYGKCRL
jgi:hypothetical protein